MKTTEHIRLEEDRDETVAWKKWGPYLSERQWGIIRSLLNFYQYDADSFKVECPTGSGKLMNLFEARAAAGGGRAKP